MPDPTPQKLKTEPPIAVVVGLPIHRTDLEGALQDCYKELQKKSASYILTLSADFAAKAIEDDELRKIVFYAHRVYAADPQLADIARSLHAPLPELVKPAELIRGVLHFAEKLSSGVFLLGADENRLEEIISFLQQEYPQLTISGAMPKPEGPVSTWDVKDIARSISQTGAEIVIIAHSSPGCEEALYQLHGQSQAGLHLGVSTHFDELEGKTPPTRKGMDKLLSSLFGESSQLYRKAKEQQAAQKPNRRDESSEEKATSESDELILSLQWRGAIVANELENIPLPVDYSRHIILDLSAVTAIDSSGLGRLAQIARQAKGHNRMLLLVSPSSIANRAIKAVKLDTILTSFPDQRTAKEHLMEKLEGTVPHRLNPTTRLATFSPHSKIDSASVERIERQILARSEEFEGGWTVLLDLAHVDFIDSTAIGRLIAIKRHLLNIRSDFFITNCNSSTLQVLKALKLERYLLRD